MTKKRSKKMESQFNETMFARFRKWTNIHDKDVDDALRDLTGDSHFEERKLLMLCLSFVEELILSGKYDGFIGDRRLTEDEKKNIEKTKEFAKVFFKKTIEEHWRDVSNKQRMGLDKLGIALKRYLKDNEN